MLQVQSSQYEFFNNRAFKYCRNTTEGYFIDSSSNQNIELGTTDYPFRMLDDPFREVFNNDYSNQEEMPLLLLNHNFSVMCYSRNITSNEIIISKDFMPTQQMMDSELISLDILKEQLFNDQITAKITITFDFTLNPYQRDKIRQTGLESQFCPYNPTVLYSDQQMIDCTALEYDYSKNIELGFMTEEDRVSTKTKFILYNASLSVYGINFIELSSQYRERDSLFYTYESFKWIKLYYNYFECIAAIVTSSLAWNIDMSYNLVNQQQLLATFYTEGGQQDCEYQYNKGLQHQMIFDKNIYYGYSEYQLQNFFFDQFFAIVSIRNNKFINSQVSQGFPYIAIAFSTDCDNDDSERLIMFENNLIDFGIEEVAPRYMALIQAKIYEYVNQKFRFEINGNIIKNIIYSSDTMSFIEINDGEMKEVTLTFTDNYFYNITNLGGNPLLNAIAQNVFISNLTIENSYIANGLDITSQNATFRYLYFTDIKNNCKQLFNM
eukprot:403357497